MRQGRAMAGIGAGMMQGLELSRRHSSEDEAADQRRRQMEQQAQQHDLAMRSGEQTYQHQSEMLPMQRDMTGLQLDDLQHSMPYNQRQRERQDTIGNIELAGAQSQQGGRMALQLLEKGDIDAVAGFLQSAYPDGPDMIEADGQGGYIGFREDENGNILEHPFTKEELAGLISGAAGIQAPERFTGLMQHPDLGYGQYGPDGKWVSHDPKDGGAGGRGRGGWAGGLKPADISRAFNDARTPMQDLLRTQTGSEFIGDRNNVASYDAAQHIAYDIINQGYVGAEQHPGWEPHNVGEYIIGRLLDGSVPGIRFDEAQAMADQEIGEMPWRERRKADRDAIAREIRDEAIQDFRNLMHQQFLGGQPQQMSGGGMQEPGGDQPGMQQPGMQQPGMGQQGGPGMQQSGGQPQGVQPGDFGVILEGGQLSDIPRPDDFSVRGPVSQEGIEQGEPVRRQQVSGLELPEINTGGGRGSEAGMEARRAIRGVGSAAEDKFRELQEYGPGFVEDSRRRLASRVPSGVTRLLVSPDFGRTLVDGLRSGVQFIQEFADPSIGGEAGEAYNRIRQAIMADEAPERSDVAMIINMIGGDEEVIAAMGDDAAEAIIRLGDEYGI